MNMVEMYFWNRGDSYASHIKCISEEEKYSGKNYVPKINKGEAKQEQWIQVHLFELYSTLVYSLRDILENMKAIFIFTCIAIKNSNFFLILLVVTD